MKRFRQLFTVYEFELKSYLQNKVFMVSSVLFIVLLFGLTFLARIPAVSDFFGEPKSITGTVDGEVNFEQIAEDDLVDTPVDIGLIDRSKIFENYDLLKNWFPLATIKEYTSVDELKKDLKSEKIEYGFEIENDSAFKFYGMNISMYDNASYAFEQALSWQHKYAYCQKNNIDFEKLANEYDTVIEVETIELGKSGEDNYWYCYAMVMIIFMVIIMYGTLIATSVTNEKSNRSIEVLITTVDINNLLFGKVLAGVTAALVQVGAMMAAVLGGYSINRSFWHEQLDMIFNIPPSVLVCFAIFGIGGFTFYACLYAAMGALVSKTEDVSKSTSTVQMAVMLVYFAAMVLLTIPDSMIMKICSYLPFTSYTCMFIRAGMGKVAAWEIVISAIILYASIFFAGWFAAKIYRMGTLRYGNQIKLMKAIKEIRKKD